MVTALRIEVNVIAACILIILAMNKRHMGKSMLDERLYQALLLASFFYALSDSVAWFIDGNLSATMRVPLYVFNILCYLFCVIVPYVWLLYAEFRLFENEDKLWKMNRLLVIPVILYILFVVTTPFTGWVFSFDENQMYQRGPLFWIQVVLSLLYVLFPTVRALHKVRETNVASERRECYNIGAFILFPLLGLIVQVLFYGISGGTITTVIAELIIFINIQNKQISLDALTKLNNRGQLNRYLNVQTNRENRKGNLYMILLDVDRFKIINDTYGHAVGDQALIDVSIILQKVCGRNGGFLSRCGGDEFAIIIEKKTDFEIEQLMLDVENETHLFNQWGGREYQLSISAGYARFGTPETPTIDKLMEASDAKMYEVKVERHKRMN